MNNAVTKLAVRSDPFIMSSLSTPPEGKSRDLKKNSGTAKKKQRYRCCYRRFNFDVLPNPREKR